MLLETPYTLDQTTDYDRFNYIQVNRIVDNSHVVRLTARIQKKNLLHLAPLIVNDKYEIFDGQHRLNAARNLLVPVYYIVDKDVTDADIISLNSVNSNWKADDYLRYYRLKGNEKYNRLYQFINKYPKIQVAVILALMNPDINARSLGRDLKDGYLNLENYQFAVQIAEYLKDLYTFLPKIAYKREFIYALAKVNKLQYNHEKLLFLLRQRTDTIYACSDSSEYYQLLCRVLTL